MPEDVCGTAPAAHGSQRLPLPCLAAPRFYPFNVYSERKRLEKLDYMHNNPVKRRLVSSPDQWPWSSSRFYHLNDTSVLSVDRLG